ncbi:S1 family peptidase [Aliagarivorans marinus]|uniref:S1 family peptidase n=1 Tax=Aliagarivorans marinus TaxID=561965 RepID=UPI0004281F2B|nr:serine protease [Aliagarivorans marinus]
MQGIRAAVCGLGLVLSCSLGAEEVSARIVGGDAAVPDNFPFFTKVFRTSGQSAYLVCGGSIIDEEWVLTAGHCIYDGSSNGVYDASLFHIAVDPNGIDTTMEQLYSVSEVYLHARYVHEGQVSAGAELDYDFALLKLATPNNEVDPASFPALSDTPIYDSHVLLGEDLTIVGYGYTAGNAPSSVPDVLMQADIPLISRRECGRYWPGYEITGQMFCTFDRSKDACNGDSGGPVLYGQPGSYQLMGVVSWGAQSCLNSPGVYADIGSVSGWVSEVLSGNVSPDSSATPTDPVAPGGDIERSEGDGGGGSAGIWLGLLLSGSLLTRRWQSQRA